MNYVRSISGSVSKTWNSINPATLSGAIDVIVVEHEDGTLACSPFHVRFGKLSLLRPYEKKVDFRVNDVRQDYAMKLGEGGEAFFVFGTSAHVPENLQTSPLISPISSPSARPLSVSSEITIPEPEHLDLAYDTRDRQKTATASRPAAVPVQIPERRAQSEYGSHPLSQSFPDESHSSGQWPAKSQSMLSKADPTAEDVPAPFHTVSFDSTQLREPAPTQVLKRSISPPPLPKHEAMSRALSLSRKLKNSNILSQVNDEGDLMLDMTGYKSSEEETQRAEVIARQILSEEVEGHYDIGSLIGADEKGNLWIYSSEEAKEAASKRTLFSGLAPPEMVPSDAISDPGYHSDDTQSQKSIELGTVREHRGSDSAVGLSTPPDSPPGPVGSSAQDHSKNYAKTLRLTSDQLKSLNLKPGANPMSFTVNRATCQANMYLWRYDVPIVISDVDGTITKSDALGHVLNMLGRDWTHLGVAKLYSNIVANGYNILYLTSRSVGQADSTRNYLAGISQEGYGLPKGAVIMSPDRTIAALRREVYLRKPEVFKMACLRDILSLFAPRRKSPFYAGFGNRLTDALSYRSVNVPSTRIFTINSNAEVSLDLLSLNTYKTGYTSMRETIDHFFPPVGMLVSEGGEEFTDFNYWRDGTLGLDEFDLSESDDEDVALQRTRSDRRGRRRCDVEEDSDGDAPDEEDDEEVEEVFSDDLGESYMSQESADGGVRPSIESVETPMPSPGAGAANSPARPVLRGEQMLSIDDIADAEDLDALDLVAEAAGRVGERRTKAKSEGAVEEELRFVEENNSLTR